MNPILEFFVKQKVENTPNNVLNENITNINYENNENEDLSFDQILENTISDDSLRSCIRQWQALKDISLSDVDKIKVIFATSGKTKEELISSIENTIRLINIEKNKLINTIEEKGECRLAPIKDLLTLDEENILSKIDQIEKLKTEVSFLNDSVENLKLEINSIINSFNEDIKNVDIIFNNKIEEWTEFQKLISGEKQNETYKN